MDIAAEADADGVHLGQDDTPLAEARAAWKVPGKLYGLSTHNEDQELAVRSLQPDYIGIGPVFPTPAKSRPDPALGVERAGGIARTTPLNSVCVGAINESNLTEILRYGARNFAVVDQRDE